ncbi:MAG TPA: WS/DGAT domain-containing protein [Polyangiaceae bacterium]|nr:WS/DGAT domain-containing protein [Polyangiaceae bacterium]
MKPLLTNRLGGEDAAWLHMEDRNNPMIVNGIVELAEQLPRERVVEIARRHLDPRMRARVVERRFGVGGPRWEADPSFDIESHIESVSLPASTEDAALRQFIGRTVSTLLDRDKPLWRLYVIERPGAGTTLLFRVHHAIGDGFALLGMLLSMCDEPPSLPMIANAVKPSGHRAAEQARSLALLALLPPDPKSLLKAELGTDKRVAWSEPLALDEIKAIAKASSATVNDVLVSTIAGALRRYLLRHGASIDDRFALRAMLPVNLRSEPATTMGNHFGLVVLTLPLGEADARDRLMTVKRRMDHLKSTPEAVVAYELLWAMGYVPRKVEGLGVDFFGKKSSLVLTNVPGPRERLHLAGVPIERMIFWVPQSAHMGLGVSIFSYAGEVTFGVISDANIIADPDALVAEMHVELAALKARSRARAAAVAAAAAAAEAPREETAAPR